MNTYADLYYSDYYRDTDVKAAYFSCNSAGTSAIEFNNYYFFQAAFTPWIEGGFAVHELGHGLRLAHPSAQNVSEYWDHRSIMFYAPRFYMEETGLNTFRKSGCAAYANACHDKDDYFATWRF